MKEILTKGLNILGLAYWVKIETKNPLCTYYFGPFTSNKEAEQAVIGYVEDLKQEGASNILVKIERCKPKELTIFDDLSEKQKFKPFARRIPSFPKKVNYPGLS